MKPKFGLKLTKTFVELARKGMWRRLSQIRYKLRFQLFVRSILFSPLTQLHHWFVYAYGVVRLFSLQYGLFLVFIGPDGCGKTTISNIIFESDLADKLFEKKYYFHTKFPFLPAFKQIACYLKIIDQDKANPIGKPRRLKPRSRVNATIHAIYYGVSNFIGKFWIKKKKTRGGSIIIFDRYYWDYLIQSEFSKSPKWLINSFLKIIPKPDIMIFLNNDPNTIYKRKKDLSFDEIERQLSVCKKVSDSYSDSYVINNNTALNNLTQQVEQIIVDKLFERFSNESSPCSPMV